MGIFRCSSCKARVGECRHTNSHLRAVDSDDPGAYSKQKAHRDARTARTSSSTRRGKR